MKFFRRDKRAVVILLATLSGLVVAAITLRIADLPNKYIFGVVLVVPFAFAFVGDVRKFMFAVFLFLVPISLNIAPFHLDPTTPPPVQHGGAQATLQIWVSQLPLMVLLFLWLVDIALKKKKIQFTPIDILVLMFIGWSTVSLFQSSRLELSGSQLLRMIMFYFVYLYIVNNLGHTQKLVFATKVLLIGFLFQSLFAIAQYWLHLPFHMSEGSMVFTGALRSEFEVGEVYRVQGTLGWPNTFGLYIAMMLPLSLSVFLTRALARGKIAFISFCFGFVALLVTFSRGAWIGAFFGALLVAYLLHRRGLIRVKVAPIALVAFVLVFFSTLMVGDEVYRRVTRTPAATSTIRIKLMKVAWEMIKAHPVTGVGLNTFTEVMRDYDKTGVSSYFPEPVHNYFLLIAAETGVVGLVLFVAIVGLSTISAASCFRCSSTIAPALTIGAVGSLFAAMGANMVDTTLSFYTTGLLFWVLLGLIGACWAFCHRLSRSEGMS